MLSSIIFVNDYAVLNGGSTKIAVDAAIGLARRGKNVAFFAPGGPIEQDLLDAGVRVVCLHQADILGDPSRLRAMTRGIWNPRAARELKSLLDEFDPRESIVHWHGYSKVLSPSAGPVVTKHAVPHVFTMHDYFLGCPNGAHFHHREQQICERLGMSLSCLTTNCDSRNAAHKVWRVARHAVALTAGNIPGGLKNLIYESQIKRRVMTPYLPKTARLFQVQNPVDALKLPPIDVAGNDVFLFVGRLVPEKGPAIFARAAKLAGVRAIFVGEGPERQAIQAANPDATITGWQNRQQVAEWLQKARVLVFPSIWYEGQPLVPMEAMSRGIPVISAPRTAAIEVIRDGETGVIVPEATPEAFADAIRQIYPRAPEMGHATYETYWDLPFTVERHVDRLLEVYDEILGGQVPQVRSLWSA